jgi:hypothetical protein
MRPAPFC